MCVAGDIESSREKMLGIRHTELTRSFVAAIAAVVRRNPGIVKDYGKYIRGMGQLLNGVETDEEVAYQNQKQEQED